MLDKYQVVEVVDLRSRTKSYKVFVRGTAGRAPPVAVGFVSRELAAAKIRELEEADKREKKP